MREGKALHSVHRGHSSSREHLLLGTWGGPGWTPFSLWMVSDIGDISLSPLCFQGHLAEGLSPGSLRASQRRGCKEGKESVFSGLLLGTPEGNSRAFRLEIQRCLRGIRGNSLLDHTGPHHEA